MNVRPLKGLKSLRALNAFHALLLGLKMLPAYLEVSYEKFYEDFKDKPEEEKETLVREAAVFVQLAEDEVIALLSFCEDPNGVPYTAVNIGNLSPSEIHECIVAVCMAIGRIRVSLVTELEKKNFQSSASTSELST